MRHPSRRRPSPERHSLAFDRRAFLEAAASVAGLTALGAAPAEDAAGLRPLLKDEAPGIPGPHPGRVVEVQHPGSIRDGVPDPEVVRRMVGRGLAALTGIDEPVEA